MIQTLKNAWKVPELRNKILFTVLALLVFRLGSAVPAPFVNTDQLGAYLESMSGTIFGLLGTMNGTAFSMAAVFALGVQPYINSSIIIELLTVAIPALERPSPGILPWPSLCCRASATTPSCGPTSCWTWVM